VAKARLLAPATRAGLSDQTAATPSLSAGLIGDLAVLRQSLRDQPDAAVALIVQPVGYAGRHPQIASVHQHWRTFVEVMCGLQAKRNEHRELGGFMAAAGDVDAQHAVPQRVFQLLRLQGGWHSGRRGWARSSLPALPPGHSA